MSSQYSFRRNCSLNMCRFDMSIHELNSGSSYVTILDSNLKSRSFTFKLLIDVCLLPFHCFLVILIVLFSFLLSFSFLVIDSLEFSWLYFS